MMRWRMIVRRIALEGASNLAMELARGIMEMVVIAPFATPTGYEIVYCSLETPRFIFLDCIPRPDVGCLPCVRGLHIFHERAKKNLRQLSIVQGSFSPL